MNKYSLYLASNSYSRKKLLQDSQIPFLIIQQCADESIIDQNCSLQQYVTALALLKMEHVVLPVAKEGDIALFLTADTMTLDYQGRLLGKPLDHADAIRMLQICRQGVTVGTAFCLEKKIFEGGVWKTLGQIIDYDQAFCVVDVPGKCIDFYLEKISYLCVSGGIAIEGFGEQFVKKIDGCYSAILGLPMYKLRQALSQF